MKLTHIAITLCSVLFAPTAAVATAQFSAVGPFTGANSESFDALAAGVFTCHPKRILGGTAELCATPPGSLFVGGTSHCSCSMQPMGTLQAMVGKGGHARIQFSTPAVRFGGYFALNCNVADGRADFFDASGVPIGSMPLTVPADCNWHWQGFAADAGVQIGSVELFSNLTAGGNLVMDQLEVDFAASVATYCMGKFNSLNCLPSIEVSGTPRAGAVSGWAVRAVQVRPGGISGTLMYAVGGSRAAIPFQCGTLCIGPNGVRRTVPAQSSLVGQLCQGTYSLDMNAYAIGALGGNPSAALSIPGTWVRCQWWGRDSGFAAPCGTTLTNAVEYVIQ